ncbi:unnamed protein product [Aphanomyces euteiches]|uniref:Uncharacterized protein n=1 Tax=Aphanomyces euteiches TaxID=100861 RepID=A0A6G0X2B4_9STRA|nr:hypothetical protein Ae201684_009219 [Aphanomyces euteiches]KAH9070360.1 hypothetical protein Ae201684P_002722 [Aphanomyces euteiches]KAH9112128.1 hypothetical protein LEN26_013320 [Aphanomyces euteiches]KAH9116482.1 hypothetical protein AeMF1_009573 [Aphanomyces euteiches]KAH9133149.1 hypothetical protein AeRB84_020703 [Aphanomyces euteiches]
MPRPDETEVVIRAAIKQDIHRRVMEKMQANPIQHPIGLREDLIAIACGILDKCIQAHSLDTVDTRLQLQFVRRMLVKELELEKVSAQLRDPTSIRPSAPSSEPAKFRLSQQLKPPLPRAARGMVCKASKAT